MSSNNDYESMMRAREEAMKLQQKMLEQMYENNPEMLAMMKQQMAQA